MTSLRLVVLGAAVIVAPCAHSQEPIAAPVGVTRDVAAPTDTVRRRPRAVEVSDAYNVRLRIHRYASYATVPLFLLQTVAGNQLFQADKSGAERPSWAKSTHSLGAAGLGALFTVNTVTGLWNLWDSRDNTQGRGKRLLHSGLMLASDAGFAYTGFVLAGDAKRDIASREDHRNYAYYSMGAALAGYAVMLVGDH
ncbi:MAG: hypothetical protein ABIY52_16955 [Gemmatimonadaceae bacterium]